MAQGLAKRCFSEEVEVFSAGINAFEGDCISKNAAAVLMEKGIDISQHKAVKLTKELIENVDLVFSMTKAQELFLSHGYPHYRKKIRCLGYLSDPPKEVSDPWGSSLETYRRCAQEIEQMLIEISRKLDSAF
ncbi:MAG: Protein-arginine-phosphatase [Candidatus Dichloromethanomonas elyunquensis]|nr:MAG: Protein-arginine-phosphatase [Candidatus Dichloromethanomonas elyunquensis]